MITPELIEKAIEERASRKDLEASEKMALAASYGGELLRPYIFPLSSKEDRAKWISRQTQTINHYENFPSIVVRKILEGVFRDEKMNRLITDVDEGDIEEFINDYLYDEYDEWIESTFADLALRHDELYIKVEEPNVSIPGIDASGTITLQDRKEHGLIPQPYLVFSSQVWNVSFTRDGKLKWICIVREETDGVRELEIIDADERCVIQLDNNKWEFREEISKHGFHSIPVVPCIYSVNYGYPQRTGRGYLTDVIRKSIGCLQYLSMFIEAVYAHLSLKIVASERTAEKTTEIGNYNFIIEYPVDLEDEPTGKKMVIPTRYLEMPNVELDKLIEIIWERIPDSIYKAANLRVTGGSATGISKLMDAVPELSTMKRVAKFLMFADEEIARLIVGKINPDLLERLVVNYDLTFDVRSIGEQVNDWAKLVETLGKGIIPKSEKGIREMAKRIYDAFLPNVDSATRNMIHEQLDEIELDFIIQATQNILSGEGEQKKEDESGGIPGVTIETKSVVAKKPRTRKTPKETA